MKSFLEYIAEKDDAKLAWVTVKDKESHTGRHVQINKETR